MLIALTKSQISKIAVHNMDNNESWHSVLVVLTHIMYYIHTVNIIVYS